MKTLHSSLIALFLATTVLFSSCEEEPDPPTPSPAVLEGLFIINEGTFNSGNGSISFRSTDGTSYNPDIYKSVNNEPLGDVVQSMSVYDRKGYICVNNSQKVVVVDLIDFHKTGTISIGSPRYFTGFSNKGYVSDWSTNSVKVIDLVNNSVMISIPCGNGPEGMVGHLQSMYVCNSGGFITDSTITVFNVNNFGVTDTIVVGVNPHSAILDRNNKIWVLCQGTTGPDFTPATADDIGGQLVQIDPANNTIMQVFQFAQHEHPFKLTKSSSSEMLYFLNGSSYYTGTLMQMSINATSLPTQSIINDQLYGYGVDHHTQDIYAGFPVFSVNSYAKRYTNTGALIDSIQAGIAPNGFVFNY